MAEAAPESSKVEPPTFYLGMDCGTQSLKAIVMDNALQCTTEVTVAFDAELPAYGTDGGCHRQGDRVTAPPLMWVEAVDLVLSKLKSQNVPVDFSLIRAVAFSAQQHATVYWNSGAANTLAELQPSKSLVEQLQDVFAVPQSPIWMDAATTVQCQRLEEQLGGPAEVAHITGSRAYERFSGNQIAYIRDHHPDQFERCERIGLASSLLPSLFLGQYASIDVGDGSGMNLLDLATRCWHPRALEICGGPALSDKLGKEVVPSHTILGVVAPYFVTRYGFSPSCAVVAGSGDNNTALVGMRARADDTVVSLGTSDTVTTTVRSALGQVEGHLMCHAILSTGYMAMLCYSNGSRTRELIRDEAVGPDWDKLNAALQATPVGNDGYVGIYFLTQEIIPQYRRKGVYRFGPGDVPLDRFPSSATPNGNYDVRAVIESQCLAKRLHATNLGYRVTQNSRLVACGGASANPFVLQVLADVFGLPVYRDAAAGVNAAAYGAAVRALHAVTLRAETQGGPEASEQVYIRLMDQTLPFELVCEPNKEHHALYCLMLRRYAYLQSLIPSVE